MDVQSVAMLLSTGVMLLKLQKKKKFVTCPPSFGTMCARIHVSCRVVRVCWLYDAHTGCGGIASSSLARWEL